MIILLIFITIFMISYVISLYLLNHSISEALSSLLLSAGLLCLMSFALSAINTYLIYFSVIYGIAFVIIIITFGKKSPVSTWKKYLEEYREIIYGRDFYVNGLQSFVNVNKKKYNYIHKNNKAFFISWVIAVIVLIIWVIIQHLVLNR